jgi:serine phosphatase RsbU (regulator of sigma subunit)
MGDVNRLVHQSSPTTFFASLFYAGYEPWSRTLQYVNAGHNPPIVARPQLQMKSCELFHMRAQAVPIGMFAETEVSDFARGEPPRGDVTLVVMKVQDDSKRQC